MTEYIHFQYGFASWEDAVRAAGGYDQQSIIETVRAAAGRVLRAEAVYEQDGVNFDHILYSWPMTAALMYAAAHCSPKPLRVLDFGGALGTSFQQNRRFLMRLPMGCDWRIVEQPAFVKVGQAEFTTASVRFFPTIDEAILDGIDVVLFGGCLMYIPNPENYINKAVAQKPAFIIVDRTQVSPHDIDLFAVQHVPASIYKANYAARTFAWHNLVGHFGDDYLMVEQWACSEQPDPNSLSIGFLLQHKDVVGSDRQIP